MASIPLAIADNLLSSVKIPPQPEVLIALQNELDKEYPNIQIIAAIIVRDSSLYSSVLRIINSPYFGMRSEIKSIPHAISLIGLDNLVTNIACIKFRDLMKQKGHVPMPRYWDSSVDTAKLCGYLAKELNIASSAEAYNVGLFADAGITILAQRYEDYKDVLIQQNESDLDCFTEVEEQRYNTTHCIVSHLMSKKWGMHQRLRDAVLYHHDLDYIINDKYEFDQETRKLILIQKMAEHVANKKRDEPDFEWQKVQEFALHFLGLSEHDYEDLSHGMLDFLANV